MHKVDDDDPFKGAEVISSYSDGDAVEDGVLVPVGRQDRVTRTVWEWLKERTPLNAQPPSNWPVDMLGWFRTVPSKAQAREIAAGGPEALAKHEQEVRDQKALALADGLICTHTRQAKRVYEQNIDGGIHKVVAKVVRGTLASIVEGAATPAPDTDYLTLWFIPNENGGITLMFPEDY